MLFSERHFAEKAFEKWCKESLSGYHQVENCASSVFVWLTSTPEGKETLKKLCQEEHKKRLTKKKEKRG